MGKTTSSIPKFIEPLFLNYDNRILKEYLTKPTLINKGAMLI